MLQQKTKKGQAVTFKHFSHQNYAVFQSLKREIRIGCLSACVLTFAHIETFASRADSTQMLHQQMPDVLLDNAEVTGSRVPLTFAETANKVSVITRQDIERAKVQSVNDLLKLCVGVDVRQRGADGVQTDISIGG
ncbi:MAG: TonB-dependent receptor plug domain-containing protein, partial [Bacteroidaceae bacterium]|nr:TonB-dependent receptor plug domain-containing protein [Bacteroidaceae bacterium]